MEVRPHGGGFKGGQCGVECANEEFCIAQPQLCVRCAPPVPNLVGDGQGLSSHGQRKRAI